MIHKKLKEDKRIKILCSFMQFCTLTTMFLCRKQCHYEFNTAFQNSCIVFCAKPKEVDLMKPNLSMTNKCVDGTQMYN